MVKWICGEAEIEARRRHAGQTVLAAGPVRQRIELDEKEHLRDRHRDHGEVDAGAPQRDQPDQIADRGGGDHADDQRQHHVGKSGAGQQIGRDKTAGAVERRLAERQQPGKAEQDIEAEAEQAPDQDPVHGVGGKAEMRQHERRNDQADRRQCLDQKGTLLEHQMTTFIRGPACRAGHAAGPPAPASSPRTA